jgi:glucose/arabinose dehydrogenase
MHRLGSWAGMAILCASFAIHAAPPADTFLQSVPGTYSEPVAVRAPHDGSGRLFIVEKGGSIRIVKNGVLLPTAFLTVSVTTDSESGLLGLAFHPNYGKPGMPHNDEFYITMTQPAGATPTALGTTPDQVLKRFTVSANPDVANTSGVLVARIADLAGNHNGGDIHFGVDGYLYWSEGDSGKQNNPDHFAECLWKKPDVANNTCSPGGGKNYFLLGKMIRLDVDNRGSAPTAEMCASNGINPAEYSIPPSNPMVGTTNTCDEIWAYGFRNPWRFSFDRQTHDLIIGDVGQGSYEEVDFQAAGTPGGIDFGWSRCEGRHYKDTAAGSGHVTDCPAVSGTTGPVIEYTHSVGCAISGGYVYRGPDVRLQGYYFYSDSCSGTLWWADATGAVWDGGNDTQHDTGLSSDGVYGFGEGEQGDLYIAFGSGSVKRIVTDLIFAHNFEQ